MNENIRTGRHCVFNLNAHLVFLPKFKGEVFTDDMLDLLKSIFDDVCTDFEAELTEFNGESDHVHLLVHYPAKVSVSKLVNALKGVSSRMLRKHYPEEVERLYWQGALWSPSYFAGSVGSADPSVLRQYIEDQTRSD